MFKLCTFNVNHSRLLSGIVDFLLSENLDNEAIQEVPKETEELNALISRYGYRWFSSLGVNDQPLKLQHILQSQILDFEKRWPWLVAPLVRAVLFFCSFWVFFQLISSPTLLSVREQLILSELYSTRTG